MSRSLAHKCSSLIQVTLPDTLTVISDGFLRDCISVKCIDLKHTALRYIGEWFAAGCHNLTSLILPDTVSQVGEKFLHEECASLRLRRRVNIVSGSTAALAAVEAGDINVV